MRALLLLRTTAYANRADQLVLNDDRQAAGNEVIGQTRGLAEVQPDHAPLEGAEPPRDGAR